MKTTSFISLVVVALGAALFVVDQSPAQGGSDALLSQWYASVTTTACSAGGECSACNAASCQTIEFKVPASGQYLLRASVKCDGVSCSNCSVCANIFNGTTLVANAHNSQCSGGDCDDVSTPNLTVGVSYTLCICKYPCPPHSCEDCPANCEGVACVTQYFGGSGPCN
jgi:hypothetical protein